MNRHRAIALVMGAILWTGAAMPALGAESGSVTAQVTVATPCIIVTPPTLDFGTLPFSTMSVEGYGRNPINVQNCGAMQEQLYGRATNASVDGTTLWTLSTTAPCWGDLNQFFLWAAKQWSEQPSVALQGTDQLLEVVDIGAPALTNEIHLIMPCVGSQGAGTVVTFDVVFTATF